MSATAGTTVYGAFDPLIAIADICKKYKIWMHVDVSVILCGVGDNYKTCLHEFISLYKKIFFYLVPVIKSVLQALTSHSSERHRTGGRYRSCDYAVLLATGTFKMGDLVWELLAFSFISKYH